MVNHPDDAESVRIAVDLEAMPAPAAVKATAREVRERQSLVGRSLTALAEAAGGKDNPLAATGGRGVVLYAWATWSPGSIALARRLPQLVPAGVTLIGVNLDTDLAAAKSLAQGESLPGEQLYDEHGMAGPLALALKLTAAPQLYVADKTGVIRAVTADRGNISAKLAAAVR